MPRAATTARMPRFTGKSFGEILALNNGAGLGFDLLRIGLALLILMSHASGISGHRGFLSSILTGILDLMGMGHDAAHTAAAPVTAAAGVVPGDEGALKGPGRPITLSYVPMFFALSGFLVTGSAFRTRNLVRFLGLRGLRLIPALMVEVVLSAIILGAVFTTLPLREYFTHPEFYAYFLNIVGEVHYRLPGVFVGTSNSPNVNSNLWTLPYEFYCYFGLSILIVTALLYKPKWLTILFVPVTIALLIANTFYGYQVVPAQLPGMVVVYYFFLGMLFYFWRDRIVYHPLIFVVCAGASYMLMRYNTTVYFYPVMLTYVTMFIGLSPIPQFRLLKSGDYSYGIYLYGYPVTQALIAAFPGLKSSLALTEVVAVAATFAFAWFSWHAVEKHCLKLKRHLSPKSSQITEALHPQAMASDAVLPVQPGAPQPAEGR